MPKNGGGRLPREGGGEMGRPGLTRGGFLESMGPIRQNRSICCAGKKNAEL